MPKKTRNDYNDNKKHKSNYAGGHRIISLQAQVYVESGCR